MKESIEKNKDIYKEYLGQDFQGFNLVNSNIIYAFDAHNAKDFNIARDNFMYNNFVEIYNTLPKGKFYGQWGLNHIFQSEQSGVKWIGASMNDTNSELNGKILSIAYAYDNCKYMSKIKNNKYSEEYFNTRSNSSYLNMNDYTDKGNCTIFKLNGENSPYAKELVWPLATKRPTEKATTDYFQYYIVIKNSEATKPLNGEYK